MTQKATQTQPVPQQPVPKKPNDTGSISVEGFVRIFDPETKEVFVEKRA
jgi:hypothetical protein